MEKLVALRRAIQTRGCSWDEVAAMYQLRMRGFLSYSPLLGIPSSPSLHAEDQELARLLLTRLGTRNTAEHASLWAAHSHGGLQVPGVVESLAAAVAADLLSLLSGDSVASRIAREQLRASMNLEPPEATADMGLLTRALRFLAGYGLYVTVSTDRVVGRILDCLAQQSSSSPQTLLGPCRQARIEDAARFCRVGYVANAVRKSVNSLRLAGQFAEDWGTADAWARELHDWDVDAAACARAAQLARRQSQLDWRTECLLFGLPATPFIPEDWPDSAWSSPSSCDPRTKALDEGLAHGLRVDVALFSDGGQSDQICTFSSQPVGFGSLGHYWDSSSASPPPVARRLPIRYGFEAVGIHEAELFGALVALRWVSLVDWNLLVCDRSAIFPVLNRARRGLWKHFRHHPIESRLARILQSLDTGWRPPALPPSWKLNLDSFPERWNVPCPSARPGAYLSRVALQVPGLVAVDIKSHQTGTSAPFPFLVAGNEAQDNACAAARAQPLPPDVHLPTGGVFAFICLEGRMVTAPAREAIRRLLRTQALQKWQTCAVQGKLARVHLGVYTPCLRLAFYTRVAPDAAWSSLLLPRDGDRVDISGFVHRCIRGIGGSWTELLHSDGAALRCAREYCERREQSLRTCPLCLSAAGTPRHVVMQCPAMAPLANHVRDLVESALAAAADPIVLRRAAPQLAAMEWGGPEARTRWPILTAWRWLVPHAPRELVLNADRGGRSAEGVRQEEPSDLGYRGLMPTSLGVCLQQASPLSRDAPEQYALLRERGAVELEASARSAAARRAAPAIRVTSLLMLGIRKIRACYLQRVEGCLAMMELDLSDLGGPAVDPGEAPPPPPHQRAPLLAQWLDGPGSSLQRELRWLVPTPEAATARISNEFRGRCPRQDVVTALLQQRGVPMLVRSLPAWHLQYAVWSDLCAALSLPRCSCNLPHGPGPDLCWHCGHIWLPDPSEPSPCPWCRRAVADAPACAVCGCQVHYRGECSSWNRGAHHVYKPGPHLPSLLCPDCIWALVQAMAASPGRHPTAHTVGALRLHLQHAHENCCPGAGSADAGNNTVVGLRRCRRWVLRCLNRHAPLPLRELEHMFQEHLAQAQGGQVQPSDMAERAVRLLVREQLAVVDGDMISLRAR